MKVFVAHFNAECNEHISHIVNRDDFHFLYGDDCVKAMKIEDIFNKNDIEVIPSIYANTSPNGMIGKETFDYICECILHPLKEHLSEIDGIYLQFHGASGVDGLDCISGEHYLVKEIRKIVGKYMPIAMVMDPHGNLTEELSNQLNIVRCFRESPHFDTVETRRKVAELLCDLMLHRRVMQPIIRKLPIMVGGERSVSANEPVRSINQLLDEAEKDPRVFSTSFHVGFIRHDDDKLGAAVVVVPNTMNDVDYCNAVADRISQYTWDHRHEFKFTGNFDEVDKSVETALNYPEKTVVITDSGDNCGAGGYGQNTIVLREMLKHKTDKKVLFAGINDPKSYDIISKCEVGETLTLNVGVEEDADSKSVRLEGTLKAVGKQQKGFSSDFDLGKSYLFNVSGTNIDVIIMNDNIQYGTMEQFDVANAPFHDYDIVVVKMGYLDTYLIPETKFHIMALSDGPTIQRSERIPFKMIARPMWPMDEFEDLYFIK